MTKNNNIILCVIEGEKTEKLIMTAIQHHFMPVDHFKYISFKADIYQFYKKMSLDNDLDAFAQLQETISTHNSSEQRHEIMQYTNEDIAAIYLFFDYDKHATGADDEKIISLIDYFNDEYTKGKIYISYPMVEAFKDSQPLTEWDWKRGKNYKGYVHGKEPNTHIDAIEKKAWEHLFKLHLIAVNQFIFQQSIIPSRPFDKQRFNQTVIFEQQQKQYIQPKQCVAVLSPFALFLIEYLDDTDALLERLQLI